MGWPVQNGCPDGPSLHNKRWITTRLKSSFGMEECEMWISSLPIPKVTEWVLGPLGPFSSESLTVSVIRQYAHSQPPSPHFAM